MANLSGGPRVAITGAVALGWIFLAGGAFAASSPGAPKASAVQAVVDCHGVADAQARLACYDDTVGKLKAAEDKGDVVSLDRAQIHAARKQAFGFTLPTLAMFDRPGRSDELTEVTDKVVSADRGGDGKLVLHLESGAVWRQTDDEDLSKRPHPGSIVVIKRAMMGSFMMNIDGQPSIKVHRDN